MTGDRFIRRVPNLLAFGLTLHLVASPHALFSATWTVTTTADQPGTSCGLPCSLRQAVEAANASGGSNVIVFAVNGTFSLTVGSSLHVTGAPSQSVTLIGNGADSTVLDGGGITRVLDIDSGATVTVASLTIQHGNAGAGDGGGIRNLGTLTLSDALIKSNHASRGGGLSNSGGAVLQISNSSILDNSGDLGGGGIRNGTGSTLTVTQSTIAGNRTDIVGGGIVSGPDSTLLVIGSTISGNSADGPGGGGGIASQAQAIVHNSTITGNTAVDHGGGIAIGAAPVGTPGVLTLKNSVVSNNVVSGSGKGRDGGGINNGSTLIVDHSSIVDNAARHDGGGIANEGGAITTITKSLITGNTAGHDGGGITNELAGSPLNSVTLTDSTVSGNTARHDGGGIFNSVGTVTLDRSTVTDNAPDNCSPSGGVPGCD